MTSNLSDGFENYAQVKLVLGNKSVYLAKVIINVRMLEIFHGLTKFRECNLCLNRLHSKAIIVLSLKIITNKIMHLFLCLNFVQ